jgi:hypothetical protein
MKSILLTASIIALSLAASAQTTFQRTYKTVNDEWLGSLVEASNGDILTVGYTSSGPAGNDDGYIMRTDNNGELLWTITSGGSELDHFISIIEDGTSDNFYIVGRSEGQGANNGEGLFGKIDGSGNILWLKAYGGDGDEGLRKIIPAANGDFFLCGYATSSFGAGEFDNYVLRVNNAGNIIWSKTFGGTLDDRARSMAIDPNGDLVIIGFVKSFGAGQKDIAVTKLDATAGTIIWSYSYGHPKTDKAQELVIDATGNIIVAGESRMDFGAGLVDNVALLHLNTLGAVNWAKLYTDVDDTKSWSLIEGIDNGYVIGTQGNIVGALNDITTEMNVLKVDDSGGIVWANTIGGNGKDMKPEIIATSDDAYLTGLSSSSFATDTMRDPYLIKMDMTGISGCHTIVKNFVEVDTSFIQTTVTWTEATGGTETTLNWTSISNTAFVNDTLCQNIVDLGFEEMTLNSIELIVSPNPSNGLFQLNNVSAENTLDVYDYKGQLTLRLNNVSEINLKNQASGMYFVYLTTSNGDAYHAKLILTD